MQICGGGQSSPHLGLSPEAGHRGGHVVLRLPAGRGPHRPQALPGGGQAGLRAAARAAARDEARGYRGRVGRAGVRGHVQ